jgi:hypothetical protein
MIRRGRFPRTGIHEAFHGATAFAKGLKEIEVNRPEAAMGEIWGRFRRLLPPDLGGARDPLQLRSDIIDAWLKEMGRRVLPYATELPAPYLKKPPSKIAEEIAARFFANQPEIFKGRFPDILRRMMKTRMGKGFLDATRQMIPPSLLKEARRTLSRKQKLIFA